MPSFADSAIGRLLRRLLPRSRGRDSEVSIRDTGTHLAVAVAPEANFASIEPDVRVLDQGMGVAARFGTTPQGAEDLFEVHFDKAKWDEAKVRSFLARNGFDHAGHDHVHLDQRATPQPPPGEWTERRGKDGRVVYENADWWVIPATVPTREGVMNRGFKPWVELDRSGRTFEGVPVTYPHPEDIVRAEDFARIGGQVRNIVVDDEARELRADTFLAKQPVPGLRVSAAAVKQNEEAVTRFLAGDRIHVSVGFLFQADATRGDHQGAAYDHVQRNIIGNHLAILGIGENAEDGACSWGAKCGLGRAQSDAHVHGSPTGEAHRDARAPHGEGSPRNEGENPMANCANDAQACSQRDRDLREARGALDQIGGHLGKPSSTTAPELLQAVRDRCAEFDRIKAERDALKAERDGLKGTVDKRVDALARECAQLEAGLNPLEQRTGEEDEAFEQRQKDALKAATDRYKAFNLDALEHQRGLLQRMAAKEKDAAKPPSKRDSARPGTQAGRDTRGATTDRLFPRKDSQEE